MFVFSKYPTTFAWKIRTKSKQMIKCLVSPDRLDAGYVITTAGGVEIARRVERDTYRRHLVTDISTEVDGDEVRAFSYSYDALGRPISRSNDAFAYNDRSEVTNAIFHFPFVCLRPRRKPHGLVMGRRRFNIHRQQPEPVRHCHVRRRHGHAFIRSLGQPHGDGAVRQEVVVSIRAFGVCAEIRTHTGLWSEVSVSGTTTFSSTRIESA